MTDSTPRITIPKLRDFKRGGQRITMVTAYDFPSAVLADEAGIDVVLVGDSLGMVVQGHDTTLGVTLEQSLYHTELVARGCKRHALVIGDMPFGSYQESVEQAIRNGAQYLAKAGASGVKLEGGAIVADRIAALVRAQIPVMAHIGLTPQSVHLMGGFKVQRAEDRLLDDARRVQEAGAFAVVLEGIPGDVAQKITAALDIPTLGIGAGVHCDGQVLVWHDILGLSLRPAPKFVKAFADLASAIRVGLAAYRDEVKAGTFPTDAHTYR